MKFKNILATALALTLCVSSASAFADESSFIEIDGNKFVMSQDAWNIDFEGAHVGSHRWGAPYVELKDSLTSSTLTNSLGNALTMHTGTTANIITSENTGDPERGDAMKFVANDNAQVQINEGAASAAGDVIMYEWDYMLDQLPVASGATITVMQPVMAGGKWLAALGVSISGTLTEFYFGSYTMPARQGVWHNVKCCVNFIDNTQSYYIDGELLGKASVDSSVQHKGQKMVSLLGNAAGTVVWIDNIRHYSLAALPSLKSLKTSGNTMEVEFTSAVGAENFVSDDKIVNISAKHNNGELEIVGCEVTANDKVLKFTTTTPIPTAVEIAIEVDYMGVDIDGVFETSPASVDFKNVVIEKSGSSFTAKAIGHNESGEDQYAIMVLVLYDANGRVAAISYSPKLPVVTDIDMFVSATSPKAETAKLFFMNGWDNPTPFKGLYYTKVSE